MAYFNTTKGLPTIIIDKFFSAFKNSFLFETAFHNDIIPVNVHFFSKRKDIIVPKTLNISNQAEMLEILHDIECTISNFLQEIEKELSNEVETKINTWLFSESTKICKEDEFGLLIQVNLFRLGIE